MVINLSSKYRKLYSTRKRYIIITGGRGSGKSFVVRDFAIRLLEEIGQGVLYTRYTMASVEKTIIPLFRKHIELIGNINDYKITTTKITHKRTGSFILFSGIKTSSGDQTANLKSLPDITTWIIEEGEDYNKEDSFIDIDDSIRDKNVQNRVIWIQNPSTREHFLYRKFFENSQSIEVIEEAGQWVDEEGDLRKFTYQKSTHHNVEHIHTTYYDNINNLDTNKVHQWESLKESNPKRWNHKYGGAWLDKSEGVIFDNWEEGEFNNSLPYLYGQDYGFSTDPTTLIKIAVDNKRKIVYLHEEFYSVLLNDKPIGQEDIYNINISRIESKNDLIIGDSQESRLIYDLGRLGLNIEECEKGQGSVKAGILDLQDYKMIVTPESSNIKIELNHYCWSDKKAGIPIDDYNHAMDAIRYGFRKLVYGTNPYIKM